MNMQYEILHMVSSVASDGLEPTWLQAIWSCWIDIFVQHFGALLLGILRYTT